jgi:hypothetical protein
VHCNGVVWRGGLALARKLKLIKERMRSLGLPPLSGKDLCPAGTSRGVGWCAVGVALEDATASSCQEVGNQH